MPFTCATPGTLVRMACAWAINGVAFTITPSALHQRCPAAHRLGRAARRRSGTLELELSRYNRQRRLAQLRLLPGAYDQPAAADHDHLRATTTWITTYHRFANRAEFLTVCKAAGWNCPPGQEPDPLLGTAVDFLGSIFASAQVRPGSVPMPGSTSTRATM